MFLFKRMNKMIHTGNNGRGPGGPRLPSDRRSDADDRCLNIPAVGMGKVGNGRNGEGWQKRHRQKIRSATVADGFVRLPPNDGDLGNVPRAG